jgi:hypothetical protein
MAQCQSDVVTLIAVRPAGRVSVRVTSVAATAPVLVTVMGKVTVAPVFTTVVGPVLSMAMLAGSLVARHVRTEPGSMPVIVHSPVDTSIVGAEVVPSCVVIWQVRSVAIQPD